MIDPFPGAFANDSVARHSLICLCAAIGAVGHHGAESGGRSGLSQEFPTLSRALANKHGWLLKQRSQIGEQTT